MTNERPTPEQMLARFQVERSNDENAPRRGRLKLFFGYAAGVGKTYSMLQAAQSLKREGKDIVIGYVEPHARPETQALTEGLEAIARLEIPYRGTLLPEFDLDAALARQPEIILIDELAHTNAPGVRHAKRWQDVEELLTAGIDVFSTVNVQHVESLNDIVAEISGIQVRETVPDEVFERADEIALVDLPPEELLERLRQGKVYVPKQAALALEQFFRKNNLVALREIALRSTADRVHEEVETARLGAAAKRPWPTNERLLVCVGPSPTSAKVVRAAKRLADRIHAPWVALHVETADSTQLDAQAQQRLHQNLKLAESLGAEVVQVSGENVSSELLKYADSRNVTKIVVGKTGKSDQFWWRPPSSLVDQMLRDSGNIDVVVVRGIDEPTSSSILTGPRAKREMLIPWLGTTAALATATLVTLGMSRLGFSEANLVMVFLLAVVAVAARFGAVPSIVASISSVFLFDVLFTQPYYWVTVEDTEYLVTFAVMLLVGLLASSLTTRVRYQADIARKNERRAEALYRLSRRLTATARTSELIKETESIVSEVFEAHAVLFLPDNQGKIRPILGHSTSFAASATEFAAAQWVLEHNEEAGSGTNTLPGAESLYLPLATPDRVVGVMAIQPNQQHQILSLDARQLLDTYATQIAFALERNYLAERSQKAELEFESEKLRSSLLSAVSHDLRTPLAAIAGAASSLLESRQELDEATKRELLDTIHDEAQRLARLVENLLHMTRLSSGHVTINRQWQPLDEVIGSALHRLGRQLGGRDVKVELGEEMLLAHVDEVLMETILVNLIDNAIKYSPAESPIEIQGAKTADGVAVEVADRGRGLLSGDEKQIFEMFYRGADAKPDRRGTGLGLAICSAIVRAHGGQIEAHNRAGGGTVIRFTIPQESSPPSLNLEADELTP